MRWHWVKGHAGDSYNERADELVHEARAELRQGADPARVPPRDIEAPRRRTREAAKSERQFSMPASPRPPLATTTSRFTWPFL